jgi:sugar-specific transcriptional regulator TrmB
MQPQRQLMDSLRRAGLTAYESEAYLALITKRELTAEEIAKMTSVPITRVYGTLDELMQKGFARTVQSRPRRYHAISPEEAKREYMTHLRRNFETNLLSIEEVMKNLQREVEPVYVESHLQVKPEELLEPIEDLKSMERKTAEHIHNASVEIMISTALFAWLPKIKSKLRTALANGVKVRILMQLPQTQVGKHLAELSALGAEIRDTKEPWHPVRGTLIDDKDLIFVIWAAEEAERYWNPIVYTPHHTKNQGLIRIFHESFDLRWNNARPVVNARLAVK